MKVRNMEGKSGRGVPNQFLIETDEGTYFQSYSTVIALKADNVYLDPMHDCSRTTVRYRNIFLGCSSKEVEERVERGHYIIKELN